MSDSQPEMMERLLIESATTDVEGKDEEYSEWRMFHVGLGSAFQLVTVNEGFQNRDFQTIQGDASVIDPEVLGKLRKEASTIWNNRLRCHLACLVALYTFLMASFFVLLSDDNSFFVLVPDDYLIFGVIVSVGVIFFLHYVAGWYLRKNADTQLNALVQSYQSYFRQEYGVEVGYGRFSLSPKGGWVKLPGIYLRRPQRLGDEEEAPVGDNSEGMDGRFPPIYLVRLIPGETHIDEKEYDAALMKVDAKTWALLQSTHQKLILWHPMMKFLAIISLLGFYVGCYWLGGHAASLGGFIGLIVYAIVYIVAKVYEYVVDNRNLKVYDEVTRVVNEALRNDEKNVAVEFHISVVPGREGKLSRRYQFVHLDSAPTK